LHFNGIVHTFCKLYCKLNDIICMSELQFIKGLYGMNSYLAPEVEKLSMNKLHYSVLLAPFQPATRIELETKINTNVECYLDVRNTSDKTLNVWKI